MNPLTEKLFAAVKTIKAGETLEFDLVGQEDSWPEAYSLVGPWLQKNPCGVSIHRTADEKKIILSKGGDSPVPATPKPVEKPIEKPVAKPIELDVSVVDDASKEEVKKPWWGGASEEKDKEL